MNRLVWNDGLVDSLRSALAQGQSGLGGVPPMLKAVLRDAAWKDRVIEQTGEHITFNHFEDFVIAQPLEGLGADLALIRKLVRDDPEALDLLDRETVQGPGASDGENQNAAENGQP